MYECNQYKFTMIKQKILVSHTAAMVVVKIDGPPILCKTDEIGELCVASEAMGVNYWGLKGKSANTFNVSICVCVFSIRDQSRSPNSSQTI